MKNSQPIQLSFVGCFLLLAGLTRAEPVDPVRPGQWHEQQANGTRPVKHWLATRIRQLEEEERQLHEKIAVLPHHDPKPLPDRMGYHSLPWDEWDSHEDGCQHIEIQFEFDPLLGAIALAPALVPGGEGIYAFPKRFKIDILDRGAGWVGGSNGRWEVPPPPYQWIEVVNWMDEDYPDPGPYPVFFSIGDVGVYQLRLTIPRGAMGADVSFHALGEIYLFRQIDNSDHLGDNMMAWDTVKVSASDSLSKPPLWDESYLNDGIVGLGMPLSEEITEAEDFLVSWEGLASDAEPVQIILDLGRVQRVGRVQLWPAKAPHGMAIPQFGFPGNVTVELSNSREFSGVNIFTANETRDRLNNDTMLNVITSAKRARYIRLTLEDLSEYRGKTILGLGEIRVSEFDEVWSLNCEISASNLPDAGIELLPRLVDGYSSNRRILREVEWIRGLAQRRPLDRRLVVVEQELEQAQDAWSGLKLQASIWGGGLIGMGLLTAMGLQRLQRRRILKKLKNRITRDLHDEVGSNLGSITLAARRMEKNGATAADFSDLSLMTREASASLKDVVWVIDQATIRLPFLLQKLAERAERVLSGMELFVEVASDCPDRVVPLTFKRHLIMFFKEAVHNCARHSDATQVWISFSADNERIEISLRDNGCGFDPAALRDGWGVDSMHKRAQELGGEMRLQSKPGEGTTVVLTVPMSALRNKTDHEYKTSN
jgi:signal transduction histidine kinase